MNHIFKSKFKAGLLVVMAATLMALVGCGAAETVQLGKADVPTEIANQLGDVMASIDDAGKGTTTIAHYSPVLDRYNKSSPQQVAFENAFNVLFPKAQAAVCGASQFGSCSSNTLVKTFGGCSVGNYVLNGTVTMSWTGGSNCELSATTQAIRITPNYTVAGNNTTLTATKTGTYGVTLTLTTSAATRVMSYTNDGIRRVLTYTGTTLMDLNTSTTSPITVTGATRSSRVLSSGAGALQVIDNTSGESCTFQPSNVTWSSVNCNCATSGQWTGSCSTLGTFTMNITSCGVAALTYTQNGTTKNTTISLDRCLGN